MQKEMLLYVGNWDHITGSRGIGLFRFQPESGKTEFKEMLNETVSCGSFLMDENRGILYVTDEVADLPGQKGGGGRVLAYKVERIDGRLEKINEAATLCPNPAYLCLDESGNYLAVANHSAFGVATEVLQNEDGEYYAKITWDDATVDLFAVEKDGSIGKLLGVAKHYGAGKKEKQFHPHPHCVVRSPIWNIFAVCDKGNDSIYFYKINREKGKLEACSGTPFHDIPGSSPRYGVFHPDKPLFYCNYEGEPVIHTFSYNEDGTVELLSSANVLPEGCSDEEKQKCEQQDLRISKKGDCLYTLVHGENTDGVSVFCLESDGSPRLRQFYQIHGKWPRGCVISPDGKYLLIGCMLSGTIEVCSIGEDGMLTFLSNCYFMPGISCMVLVSENSH